MKELIPSETPGMTACPAAFPLVFEERKKERKKSGGTNYPEVSRLD